jgi:hypothetical protein
VDPTVPLPGAGAPGQFPPPTDPWAAPDTVPGAPGAPSRAPGAAPGAPGASSWGPGGPPEPSTPVPAQLAPTSGAPGPVVAQIGEIAVTSTAAHTPAGEIPLAGSTWQVADYWQTEQRTPKWAILMAIVGFCVLTVFSLLFLLVKETVHRGTVQVTVTNGARQYVARIPVASQDQVLRLHQQVNYVRALAAL